MSTSKNVSRDNGANQTLNEQLLGAAQAYHELGVPVIPFKIWKENDVYEKKNIGYWKQWLTDPQTDAEFNALDWREANAIGVILGTQAKNGLYLSAIDYDTKGKVTEEAKAKGKEILKEFPITQTDETVNNGIHLMYWSRNKVTTDGTFHDVAALELLGEKKLCLIPPSEGYKSINDNSPTETENLEDTFYAVLKKHGLFLTEETEIQNQQDKFSFQISKLVDLSIMTKINADEYQGSHPIHDSTTEKNFCVNTQKNTWKCFRHDSGGGVLQYLAMKEGLIKCEQAKKGALRGKKFHDVLNLAVANGLLDEKVLNQSEINPVILAKDIMEDYPFIVDQENGTLYFYDKKIGLYCENTERQIKREIAKRLDENFKARYYSEINEFITATAPLVQLNDKPELIAAQNGILNLKTLELIPPSPEYYLTVRINANYDKNAQCPAIEKFLGEILDEKQRKQAQEFIGYCLFRKITVQTSTCLCVGIGANGKSVFLELATRLLGPENVSNHTIQSLCYDKFITGEVKGKLCNISADLPSKEIQSTGLFKQLTTGDRVTGQIKHVQKPFYFNPFAKYLFSANALPPIASTEDFYAWYRRFLILDFTNTFKGKAADKHLIDKLTTPEELSGYLNHILAGLKQLEENGDYTEQANETDVRKAYIKRSNSCLAFIEAKLRITDNYEDHIFNDALYREYVTYCHAENLTTKPKAALSKTMEQYCNGAEKTKIRPNKQSSPLSAWRYISFVPTVPDVPAFENNRGQIEKNTIEKFTDKNELVEKRGTNGTNGTKRFCSDECINFGYPACTAPNPLERSGNAEIPLGCPGYDQKGAEAS